MASAQPQGQSFTIYICGPSNSTFTEIWTEEENNAYRSGARNTIKVISDFDGTTCDIVNKTYHRDKDLVLSGTERTLQSSLEYRHNSVVVFLFLIDELEYGQAEENTTLKDITRQDDSYFEALLVLHRYQYAHEVFPAVGIWVYNSLALGDTSVLESFVERFSRIAEAQEKSQIFTFFSNNERDNWDPIETVYRLAVHIKDLHIAAAETYIV